MGNKKNGKQDEGGKRDHTPHENEQAIQKIKALQK
jgi:hypothetical protein